MARYGEEGYCFTQTVIVQVKWTIFTEKISGHSEVYSSSV